MPRVIGRLWAEREVGSMGHEEICSGCSRVKPGKKI